MTSEFIKSDTFKKQFNKTGKTPISKLVGLSKILNNWNKERLSTIENINSADLSISDIQSLKEIIKKETLRTKIDHPDIVADQILFLLIGAIKLQVQSNTDRPWDLVNQSIKNFLNPVKTYQKYMITFSVFTFIIILCFAITVLSLQKKSNENKIINSIPTESSINVAGSQTVNNLIAVYKAMNEGECQLPQAAMLNPREREAFVTFITEGSVSINTAENLKTALSYAKCQYPQKLMNNPLNF